MPAQSLCHVMAHSLDGCVFFPIEGDSYSRGLFYQDTANIYYIKHSIVTVISPGCLDSEQSMLLVLY